VFPCGHTYFSIRVDENVSSMQVLGSILPDAATTGTFEWTDLHNPRRLQEFSNHIGGDTKLQQLVRGSVHHQQLDARSHDAWNEAGGYAYELQTPALRALAEWLQTDEGQVHARLTAFVDVWKQPHTSTAAMVDLWKRLMPLLNESTFDNDIKRLDEVVLRQAIDLAVDLVHDSHLAVLTP
jgi:hypothetical protein